MAPFNRLGGQAEHVTSRMLNRSGESIPTLRYEGKVVANVLLKTKDEFKCIAPRAETNDGISSVVVSPCQLSAIVRLNPERPELSCLWAGFRPTCRTLDRFADMFPKRLGGAKFLDVGGLPISTWGCSGDIGTSLVSPGSLSR